VSRTNSVASRASLLSGIIAPEIEIVFVAPLDEVIIFESPSEPGACSVPTPFSERLSGKARYPCRLPDFCFSTYETDTCSAVGRLDTSVESFDMSGEESRLGTLITTTPLCFGVRL
jgi:hypothetical protein